MKMVSKFGIRPGIPGAGISQLWQSPILNWHLIIDLERMKIRVDFGRI